MSMKKKLFAAAAAAALISAVSVGTASADGFSNASTPGFTITGGTGPRFDTAVAGGTSFPTVGAFNSVTMNGTPQLTSASIAPFTVIDDSGTGAGWSVTLTVPNFTDVGGDVVAAAGAQKARHGGPRKPTGTRTPMRLFPSSNGGCHGTTRPYSTRPR